MSEGPVTLGAHVLAEATSGAGAEAGLVVLMQQLDFAAKVIARETRRAALVGRLGLVGDRNATGDAQKKMDVFANSVFLDAFAAPGLVAGVVSEEEERLSKRAGSGDAAYFVCTDPIDGSSNSDVNGAVGTIFSFLRRRRTGSVRDLEEELFDHTDLAAAGYVMYGPSTLLVYTTGNGVSGFTLDHDLGAFLLSHEAIRCPPHGALYSANLGHQHEWDAGVRRFVAHVTQEDADSRRPYSLRYTGALVADLHRSLVEGGVYFYPADAAHPEGKLRLLYECAPLAFVVEQAGGRASDGTRRILDIPRRALHQRVPLVIGSRDEVALYESFAGGGGPR